MAEDYNTGSNWWDSSRARFDTASSSSSSGLSSLGVGGGSFGWPTEMVDVKARSSSMESASVSDSFHDIKLQQAGHGHDSGTGGDHLHMMGLALSSQSVDWNQALL